MIVLHIVEKFFNSGAFSSLMEIYNALSTSYLVSSQKIICLKIGSAKKHMAIPDSFPKCSQVMYHYDFLKYIKSNGPENFVCIFHKLMCSPTRSISSIICQSGSSSIVVNHTFTEVMSYNKLYKFDACVAVSDHMLKKIEKINSRIKFFSIRNIVDAERIGRYEGGRKNSDVYLSGRINAFNNIKYSSDFIKWISGIRLNKPHIHQYIGSGPYIKDAISVSESFSNSNSRVDIVGPVWEEKEKIKILKSWDAFIYDINRPEGTSMSVLESIACGVPVICKNLPGNNELIFNGVNGFVFSDYQDATRIVNDFFKNEKNIHEMKMSTLNWALENLNKNKLREKYEEVINWVIDNRGKSNGEKISKKYVASKDGDKRQKIKKIVVSRGDIIKNNYQSKNISKSSGLHYKKDSVNLKSSISYKLGSSDSGSKLVKKTYFPILLFDDFVKREIFFADFLIVKHYSNGNNFDYSGIDFSKKDQLIYVNNNKKISVADLESKILFKKTDIIIIPLSCVYKFKNYLLYNENNIWEEKEK